MTEDIAVTIGLVTMVVLVGAIVLSAIERRLRQKHRDEETGD